MSTDNLDLEAIRQRYWDWYGNCDGSSSCQKGCSHPVQGDWSKRDGDDETLSHCIVRNDVPELVAEVERLTRERDAVVEAVRAIHHPSPDGGSNGRQVCDECTAGGYSGFDVEWPCDTAKALSAATRDGGAE